MSTDIAVDTQIVQSCRPNPDVMKVIVQTMFNTGRLDAYATGRLGSAFYVEVPRHLNSIHEQCGDGAVRDALAKLLSGEDSYLWDMVEDKPYLF